MNLIHYNYRSQLSKKILDFVETSKLKWKIIDSLKITREYQIKQSDDEFVKTKIPKNHDINFCCFQLYEVFWIDNYNILEEGLSRLLPYLQKEKHFSSKSILDNIREASNKLSSSSWWRLGFLVSDSKEKRWYTNSINHFHKFPKGVKFIDLNLYKTFPSFFLLAFNCYLEKSKSDELKKIQQKKYLPEFKFNKFFPLNRFIFSSSESTSQIVKEQHIQKWHNSLKIETQMFILSYLKGFFLSWGDNKTLKLPSVDIYNIICSVLTWCCIKLIKYSHEASKFHQELFLLFVYPCLVFYSYSIR